MSLWGDERGAAVQVGVAILLAFVVLAITTYQVEVVPNQNAEIEFDHNQDVQNQLQELRGDIVGVSDGNSGGSQAVQLGTSYPARTIFVNPPAPSGSLETVEPGDGTIEIENAVAATDDGTEDYWDGDVPPFDTAAIEYRPRYNEFRSAPEATVYEHSALYNENPNDAVTGVADQLLVDDDEITIVALQGDLDENSRQSVSVRTRALSRTANTVTIEPEDGEEIELTIPTEQPDFWADELEAELDASAIDSQPANDQVVVELDESYDLRMAQVGVGQVTRDPPEERAEYIVEIDDRAPTVVAQVRDQFNNPVRNFENVSLADGSAGELESDRTNSQGEVRVGDVEDEDRVEIEIFDGNEEFENVTINVEGGGGGGGGGGAYSVDWNQQKINEENSNVECNGDCTINGSADAELWMETNPTADGANVDFSVSDTSVGTVDPNSETTDGDGEASTMFTIDSEAEDGDEVTVFTSSGGDGDQLNVELNITAPPGPEFLSLNVSPSDVSGANIREVEFDYETSGGTINFRVYEGEDTDGDQVGSETGITDSGPRSEFVDIDNTQPPITIEAEVIDGGSGERCVGTISDADEVEEISLNEEIDCSDL